MLGICLTFVVQIQGFQLRDVSAKDDAKTDKFPAQKFLGQDVAEKNETSIDKFLAQNKPKVFFIAALEGSGTAVFQTLWKNSYDITTDEPRHVVKFPQDWFCGNDWQFGGFDIMVDKLRKVKQNDIKAMPFQATYPSCGAHAHNHTNRYYNFHPDLEWLQKGADEAGVALHVIFINRNPEECLKLTCKKRDYENCTAQAETLVHNADLLMKQIRAIDNSKVSCFDYSSDADVLKAVHDEFGNSLPPIEKAFSDRDLNASGGLTDVTLDKIQDHKTSMSSLCHTLSQFTIKDFKQFIHKGHGDETHLANKVFLELE